MLSELKRLFEFEQPEEFELLETPSEQGVPRAPRDTKEKTREAKDVPVSRRLDDNADALKRCFRSDINADIGLRPLRIANRFDALLAYISGMSSTEMINDFILKPAMKHDSLEDGARNVSDAVMRMAVNVGEARLEKSFTKAVGAILEGQSVLFIDGDANAIVMDTRGYEKRSVGEPANERVVRGPHEGFNESLRTNITLIRRIVRTPDLVSELRPVGADNNIQLAILYREGVVNPALLKEVKRRLAMVSTRFVFGEGMLEQLTERSPLSLTTQVLNTERPDRVAGMLMNGYVAIVVDGAPYATVVPMTLPTLLSTSEDLYMRKPIGTVIRIVRFVGLMLSVFLPGVYISIALYHHGLISSELIMTILLAREQVALPMYMEMLFLILMFQLVREAGLRLPSSVGQSIGIVGGLILGQAVVTANIVSTVMLIVVAMAELGGFAIPDYSTQLSALFAQLMLIAAGTLFGLLGVMAGTVILIAYLCNMKSYGVPFMAPFAPKTFGYSQALWRDTLKNRRGAHDIINAIDGEKP